VGMLYDSMYLVTSLMSHVVKDAKSCCPVLYIHAISGAIKVTVGQRIRFVISLVRTHGPSAVIFVEKVVIPVSSALRLFVR